MNCSVIIFFCNNYYYCKMKLFLGWVGKGELHNVGVVVVIFVLDWDCL